MLRLLIGKAGSGKTAAVIGEIRRAVQAGRGGSMLLVPEQYSHEAERELCRACGDSLSLYAEVFSFTGLARRVLQQQGGAAVPWLDKGGRLLCMALALEQVGSRLRVYDEARRRSELQAMLLAAVDECKSACVTPEMLEEAAAGCDDSLGDKLSDLALIQSAYDAIAANGRADPSDRLSVLAEKIASSDLGPANRVYVDGFIDFTRQEQAVLTALLQKGVELTVCMTVDEPEGENEIFALSRISCRRLLDAARELGVPSRTETLRGASKPDVLRFFSDHMFSWSPARWEGSEPPVYLAAAESISAECEYAAARILALVRNDGFRWRDLAVAVRGFEAYRGTLESVFRHYGIPLFTAQRSELLQKPLPALIALAYEILESGWDVDDLISYLRTGLTGLSLEECDELSDYIYKWQLRAGAWERVGAWRQHPDGYGAPYDEAAEEALRRLNALRERLRAPLLHLRERGLAAETAEGQAAALAAFLEELRLPEQLERRSQALEANGQQALAAEYRQLWELTVSALEQAAAILGESAMDMWDFGRLFLRMLSQYDVGIIPVSLDRVSAGDFDRMRRRTIRHLFVLGCSDDRLPLAGEENRVFTGEERELLLQMNIDLGGGDGELWREFSLIYHCLTLPDRGLHLSYPVTGADGEALRPSLVFSRAEALFSLSVESAAASQLRLAAEAPALTLAASALHGARGAAQAAAAYFRETQPERFARIEQAAAMRRGRLSPEAVRALYGSRLRLSASRIDKFASCRFAYFCQYGLQAKKYEPAGFTPPEIGTFMHYVLEHVARAAAARGGFAALSDEELHALTEDTVAAYVHGELNDFKEKSSRFLHLFRRLTRDVHRVVDDMAGELRRSDFVPLDFELDFSRAQDIRPVELGRGEAAVTLTGIADRVDGWVHGDKLYLRVVDYKTGVKKFSLSDVWYGMGLQMLLYLFALENDGAGRYGREIVPAGVMYVPARSVLLPMDADADDEHVEKERRSLLRRSGLVLDDPALMEAWEKGEDKRYIPVKFKNGKAGADGVASLERLGELAGHIRKTLGGMAEALSRGSVAADPYYRSQQENACLNCEYFDACHFADGENGEHIRYLPKYSDKQVWGMLEEQRLDRQDGEAPAEEARRSAQTHL